MLVTLLVWVPLVLALAIVVSAWIRSKAPCQAKLGPLNWSFSDSWASNLTVLLVLFETLLAADLLPETGSSLPSTTYTALGGLFGGLILAAPLLYLVSGDLVKAIPPSTPAAVNTQGTNGDEQMDVQVQGRVYGFALAAALVLWAVIGQLTTTVLLAIDLGVTLPQEIGGLLVALAAVLLLLATIHSERTIRFILRNLVWEEPADATHLQQELKTNRLARLYDRGRAPRWTMP